MMEEVNTIQINSKNIVKKLDWIDNRQFLYSATKQSC